MSNIALNCRIFVDGADLADALTEITPDHQVDSVESTTLASSGNKTFEIGLNKGGLSATGIFDADATNENKIADILGAAFTNRSKLVVTASLGAISLGGLALMCKGVDAKHDVSNQLGRLIMASAQIEADKDVFHGKWIYNSSASSSNNGTSNDNAAATTNGGMFHAHVYLQSDSGATNVSFTLQHSTDNSTWVDLVAATAIGGAKGAIAVMVPYGTTVRRYLRVVFAPTGGKAYGVAAFKRF